MEFLKFYIVVILCVAISSCNNIREQKNTVLELQTQELSVSEIDTMPEIIPLFDSCVLRNLCFDEQIVVNSDTIFIRDKDSTQIDYPIPLDIKNLITDGINKLYIEKSVPIVRETKKYDPKYYVYYERCEFYAFIVYFKSKKEYIEVYDEIYHGNDTIIHSLEYDNLIKSIDGIVYR